MQNWNRFPRVILALSLLIALCAGLFAPRVEKVEAKPLGANALNIIISEFRTRGPLGAEDEFIEIYNPTNASIDISNWEIHGSNSSGGGTTTPRATIPVGTILQPGQYYLIANTVFSTVSANLTYGTGIADDGGIALTLADDTVVDAVGMSAGSAYSEGTTLLQLTTNTNQSYERKLGGASDSCQDDGDNSTDFQLMTPSNPQNLSTLTRLCGGNANLTLTQTVDNATPIVGDTVTFTIIVSNAGTGDARIVEVKDALPPGLTFSPSTSATQGSYSDTTGIWTVGTITNGANATLTLVATVAIGGVKTNWAEVWSSYDQDPTSIPGNSSITEDDDASTTVTVPGPAPVLNITNVVNNPTPNVGTNVVFTITVSNPATNLFGTAAVNVAAPLPSGLTYVSSSPVGSYNSGTGNWSVGNLASGASTTLNITALAATSGTKNFSAEVSSNGFANSIATVTVTPVANTPTATSTATPTSPPGILSVLINEIGWAGTALTPVDRTGDEWIELYNTGSTDINLDGWELRMSVNNGAETVLVPFGAADKILKNNFFILAREDSTGNYDIFNDVTENKPFSATLPNTNSIVLRLYDSQDNVIDTANSGKSTGWYAGTAASTYDTMERRGKVLDGPSAWATFGGTPFAHNRNGVSVRGTPGRANWIVSITPTPTRFRTATVEPPDTATPVPIYIPPDPRPIINEILPRPGFDWNKDGRVDVFDEFVEIKNLTSISISLNGWRLDDELNLGSNPFALPDVTLNPGERIVFYASQTNILLSDGGDTVRLISPNGKIYDAYTYSIAKVEDQTICRLPDGNVYNGWFEDCVPTPNLNNSREGTVPVMPDVSYESPICKLPDTLPADFLLAECRGYGANIWDADFWDQPDTSAARYIPQNTSKWEAIIE